VADDGRSPLKPAFRLLFDRRAAPDAVKPCRHSSPEGTPIARLLGRSTHDPTVRPAMTGGAMT